MNLDLTGPWTEPDTEQVMSGMYAKGNVKLKAYCCLIHFAYTIEMVEFIC